MSGTDGGRRGVLSRRALIGGAVTASLGALAGCSGILGGSGPVWEDEFEAGALERYTTVSIEGDQGPEGFRVGEKPAGEGTALLQATEDRILVPSDDVAITPPVTVTFDVYIDGWAGMDFLLQWDRDADRSFDVQVRRNANGDFIQLQKKADRAGTDRRTLTADVLGKSGGAVAPSQSWERVTVRWADGAIEATTATADETVRIEEADGTLRGNPFAIHGYRYSGFAALDFLVIRSPGKPISETTAGQS